MTVRPAVFDVYQMKTERLPEGAMAAWLRTRPGEQPDLDQWSFVGRERHPSKWTIAQMDQQGFCYLEIPSWLKTSRS
jgi:hypothetical protein